VSEPRCGKTTSGNLLNYGEHVESVCSQFIDKSFRFVVVDDRHREVSITSETRFRPQGHGKSADEGKWLATLAKCAGHLGE
jgi:hypothetical protein